MKTCLIGEKLNYSLSSKIHEILGNKSYELVELKKDELSSFFESKKYNAFNVTIPYKKRVMEYLDHIDKTAKKVGAVNTVVLKDGEYYGYNTDVYGLEKSLEENDISLNNKNVLILGSGGASNACKFVVKENSGKAFIVSRRGKINYSTMYEIDANVVINATPVGDINHIASNIDLSKFKNLEAVIDLVYNPINTKMIQNAKALKIKTVNGLCMLVNQAIKANQLFFAKNALENSKEIEDTVLKEQRNIVLIGMSGVGKTAVGEKLAEELGYSFVDTDQMIEERYGSIVDIFSIYGEKKFRKYEKEIVKEVSLKNNYVISIGGGAILDNDNATYLKSNGILILLNRAMGDIDIINRPLIDNRDEMIKLYEKRKAAYNANADYIVDNNRLIKDTINQIKELL